MTDKTVPIPDPRLFVSFSAPAQNLAHSPNGGIVVYPPRATLGPRVQRDYQLVLVHAGTVLITIDEAVREVLPGHVTLLLPGHTEFFVFDRERQTRHSWIALAPSLMDASLRDALHQAPVLLPLSPALHACVEVGYETAEVDDPAQRWVLAAVARAALTLYLAEAIHAAETHMAAAHPIAVQARTLARRRATEGIGVDDLAREVGVSSEHLIRLFQKAYGVTPGAFLHQERLSRGMRLLEDTGLTVVEVARRSGFASPHHFARCVRVATGMTPSQVRMRSWTRT